MPGGPDQSCTLNDSQFGKMKKGKIKLGSLLQITSTRTEREK